MNKKTLTISILLAMIIGLFAFRTKSPSSDDESNKELYKKNILISTFPIYQIVKNVAKDSKTSDVKLMLPSQLGCPHDYALTPDDLKKLAVADVLVINGHGMEEFLGAPVKETNSDVIVLDSSKGIDDIIEIEKPAYEWAGAFNLEPGTYNWSFAKIKGSYADPGMKIYYVKVDSEDPINAKKDLVEKIYEEDGVELRDGGSMEINKLTKLMFNQASELTNFKINIDSPGTYVFYTEHSPYEFEADEHYLKDSNGTNVEPIEEDPEVEHNGTHGAGENPYEWAGAFNLGIGTYNWSFAKIKGAYADPGMKIYYTRVDSEDPINAKKDLVVKSYDKDGIELLDGGFMEVDKLLILTFNQNSEVTNFKIKIENPGTYVFYTAHSPYEFEADEHYLKDANGTNIEPIKEDPASGHHHHHHHHHSGVNPHLFVSPKMTAKLALNIANQLAEVDPAGAALYQENAKKYADKMNSLAAEMLSMGSTLKNNRIIQPHGIFDYLARDMSLEIIGVLQPHGQEPSASEMIKLTKDILEKKVGAIFSEPQYSDKISKALSRETGVPSGLLDPVASGPENAPLDYYETVMRQNMNVLDSLLN